MNSRQLDPARSTDPRVVNRVAVRHWHALEDDCVVGRGATTDGAAGRTLLSIDAWHTPVFDALAAAMLSDLPRPLFTLVDEGDVELAEQWRRAGFVTRRRESTLVMDTDPEATGLREAAPPRGVRLLPIGEADPRPLRRLLQTVHHETGGEVGPELRFPERYAVAVWGGEYVGMLRVAPLPRQPRLGLVAVRRDVRRCGIARALLAETLGRLHADGVPEVSTDVWDDDEAAVALVEGIGARRVGSSLELVLR